LIERCLHTWRIAGRPEPDHHFGLPGIAEARQRVGIYGRAHEVFNHCEGGQWHE
jgi:hypothetical protein